MSNIDLSLNKHELCAWGVHTAVGALLARQVCHLPWKEACLWSAVGFYIANAVFVNFKQIFEETIPDQCGLITDKLSRSTVKQISGVAALVLLSYVSNKAMSYLMKVPSTFFAITVTPGLFLGSIGIITYYEVMS